MAEKIQKNWKTSASGFIVIAASLLQHFLMGTPISVEAVIAGLGLITAGDAQ